VRRKHRWQPQRKGRRHVSHESRNRSNESEHGGMGLFKVAPRAFGAGAYLDWNRPIRNSKKIANFGLSDRRCQFSIHAQEI